MRMLNLMCYITHSDIIFLYQFAQARPHNVLRTFPSLDIVGYEYSHNHSALKDSQNAKDWWQIGCSQLQTIHMRFIELRAITNSHS